jgi:O-antigen ligase
LVSPDQPSASDLRGRLFAGLFGAFLGLALLKFNNPPIMEKYVEAPAGLFEFLLGNPWPIAWGYWLLVLLLVFGISVARRPRTVPVWLLVVPLAWWLWQCLAALHSVDTALSYATVKHLGACVLCFYLGCFALGPIQHLGWFWGCLIVAFCLVLVEGWTQRFGGLDESRRYFYLYVYPTAKDVPREYLTRLNSTRIFATLFYPNALAGALLLVLPPALVSLAQIRDRLTPAARGFLAVVVGLAGLACLFWSGSKGGWLLMLVIGLIALFQMPLGRGFKIGLLSFVLVAGLAGFFVKYASFFQKGATSVGARFDYWSAALQTTVRNPILGTGPGTFAIPYGQLKRPESEATRLVHNDYLEQASDSGLPGFLFYGFLILGALKYAFPKSDRPPPGRELRRSPRDWLPFAVWLGVLAWSLQSLMEFSLYIPALAWMAFSFLGWLLGRPRPLMDRPGLGQAALSKHTPN